MEAPGPPPAFGVERVGPASAVMVKRMATERAPGRRQQMWPYVVVSKCWVLHLCGVIAVKGVPITEPEFLPREPDSALIRGLETQRGLQERITRVLRTCVWMHARVPGVHVWLAHMWLSGRPSHVRLQLAAKPCGRFSSTSTG